MQSCDSFVLGLRGGPYRDVKGFFQSCYHLKHFGFLAA